MIQYHFIDSMSPSEIDDFNLNQSNQYDISIIEHFIHNPVPSKPMNDVERHNHIVETRNRIDCIKTAILNYETANIENS